MEHTYLPKQFGKLVGKSVNTLQKWDRKGILSSFRSPTNRRYYTHEQYLRYRGLIFSEHGTEILVMDGGSFSPEEELVRDLLAIVTVFSARLHGLRSQKNAIRAAARRKDGKR